MIIFTALTLTGCGGGGGGGSSITQMGGARQGIPLNLTGAVTTPIGNLGVSGSANGTGSAATFNLAYGITTDGTNLYVADSNNHTIRQIVIASGVVSTLAGTAGAALLTDGTGSAARFKNPRGITTDGTNLYVADYNNHAIRKIVIASGVVSTLAGLVSTLNGAASPSGSADGTGSAARFNQPYGITTDGTNLYVADSVNHTIRQIVIATGVVSTLAGTAGLPPGLVNDTGLAARFSFPVGITTDGTNLYVADSGNNAIRKIVIATGVVSTLAGAGTAGSANGTGIAATFDVPRSITTDGTNLYVTDTSNNTIRQIVIATGEVTTLAGTVGTAGSANGTGIAATFNFPSSITSDGAKLYLTDSNNFTIRQIQ